MKNKNKTAVLHGNIKSLPVRRLGDLKMKGIPGADAFGITFLQEALQPFSSAPYVVHSRTIELVYVTEGKMSGYLDGKRIPLVKGDYLFIPAGVEHRFETRKHKVTAVSMFFPPMNMDAPDAKIVFKKKRARGLK